MKLSEMVSKMSRYLEDHPKEDPVVCIMLNKPSIGPLAVSKVSSLSFGFDWNKDRVILTAEEPLVVKPDDMKIYHDSSDLLFSMAQHGEGLKRKTWPWYMAMNIMKRRMTDEEYRRLIKKEG